LRQRDEVFHPFELHGGARLLAAQGVDWLDVHRDGS
jgi:hypothetical protein